MSDNDVHLMRNIDAAQRALADALDCIHRKMVDADDNTFYALAALGRGEVSHATTWLEEVGESLRSTATDTDPATMLAAWADALNAYEDRVRANYEAAVAKVREAAEKGCDDE